MANAVEQCIWLNLGRGDWTSGFANVSVRIQASHELPVSVEGKLPAAPELWTMYNRWQQLYEALYGGSPWRITQRHSSKAVDGFEFDTTALTRISRHEFETIATDLKSAFNQWLLSATFAEVGHQIRDNLTAQSAVSVMLTAQSETVLRFPWRLWQLFEDYPKAELSVSLANYRHSLKQARPQPAAAVKILAVLGNDSDIDVETDRNILAQLPTAQITLLAQPTMAELYQHLWRGRWDMLFFAGHSTSQGEGYLQVNATESLTVKQLKHVLQRAIVNGLQLAILNSCDGLGLAWQLADLYLPQAIVMREPVSDAIAQQFLKAFLLEFSSGQSLYLSVRAARENLRSLPGTYAAWLPVIVQNPLEQPVTWQSLLNFSVEKIVVEKNAATQRSFQPESSSVETVTSLIRPINARENIAKRNSFSRLMMFLKRLGQLILNGLRKLRH